MKLKKVSLLIFLCISLIVSSGCTSPGSNGIGTDNSENSGDGNAVPPGESLPISFLTTDELIIYAPTYNNEIPINGKVNADAAGFYLAASSIEFQSEIVSNLTIPDKKLDVILNVVKDLYRPISSAHATTITLEEPAPNVNTHTCDEAGVSYTKINFDGSLEGPIYVPADSETVYLAITNCTGTWSEIKTNEVNHALNFYNSIPKTMTVVDNVDDTQLLVIDESGNLKQSLITDDAFTTLGDRNDNFTQRNDLSGNNKLSFDDDTKKVVALSDDVGATSWNVDQQNVDDPFELVDDLLSQVVDTEKYTYLKKTFDGSTWYGRRPDPNADLNSVANIYRATEVNPAGTPFCNANPDLESANCIEFKETIVFDRTNNEPNTVIIAAANISDSEAKFYLKYIVDHRHDRDLELGGNNSFNLNDHDFIDLTIIEDQVSEKTGKVLMTDKIQKGFWILEYFIDELGNNDIFTDELNSNKFISLDKSPIAVDFDKNKNNVFVLLEGDEIQSFKLKNATGNMQNLEAIKNSKSVINLKNVVNKNVTVNANSLSVHQTSDTSAKLFIGSSGILGAMTVSVDIDEVEKQNPPQNKKPNNLGEDGSIINQSEENEDDIEDGGGYF